MGKQQKKVSRTIKVENAWKKKWNDGRDLILRVTERLRATEQKNEALEAKLKAANAIIGALIYQKPDGILADGTRGGFVAKSSVTIVLEKHSVMATECESEISPGYDITVTPR